MKPNTITKPVSIGKRFRKLYGWTVYARFHKENTTDEAYYGLTSEQADIRLAELKAKYELKQL